MCKYCNNTFENRPVNGECVLETHWTYRLITFFVSTMFSGLVSFLLFAAMRWLNKFQDRADLIVSIVWIILFLIIFQFANKLYQPIFFIEENLQDTEEKIDFNGKFFLIEGKVQYNYRKYAIPNRFKPSPQDLVEFLNCNEWKKK
jgi:hypothetical protein